MIQEVSLSSVIQRCHMQYHFTTRCHSFPIPVKKQNKLAPCRFSTAFSAAALNLYRHKQLDHWWTMSSDEVSAQYSSQWTFSAFLWLPEEEMHTQLHKCAVTEQPARKQQIDGAVMSNFHDAAVPVQKNNPGVLIRWILHAHQKPATLKQQISYHLR